MVKNQREKELKPILKALGVKQLKKICEELGIRKPNYREGGWFQDDVPPSKPDYIKKIIKSDVDTDKIKTLVHKFLGLPSSVSNTALVQQAGIVQKAEEAKAVQETKIKSETSIELNTIANVLLNQYQKTIRDMEFGSERDFHNQLLVFLTAKFSDMEVKDVSRIARSGDIAINKKFVIEAKYANGEATLNKGYGELMDYRSKYEGILMVILDVDLMKSEKLETFVRNYEEQGAKVVTLQARAKEKKE